MKFDISKCERAMALNGWSQGMVAKRARLSQSVVSNFLNGKPVRITTVKRIVTSLGLTMAEVVKAA